MIRLWRVIAVLVLSGGLAAAGATPATAHTELEKSDPAAGQTLERAPREVTLTFSGRMLALGAIVQVKGPAGVVDAGRPKVGGRTVTQPLGAGLTDGGYVVSWRLTSSDGHVRSGTFGFRVETGAPAPSPAAASPAPPSVAPSAVPVREAAPEAEAMAPMDHGANDSLPAGWVALGLVVLALVIAGAGLTEVRRRRRLRAAGPRGRPTG